MGKRTKIFEDILIFSTGLLIGLLITAGLPELAEQGGGNTKSRDEQIIAPQTVAGVSPFEANIREPLQ
ncbi:hypothetical protein [Roseibium sp. MMSF_3544]|uniref:hypothetical protein n=1 Tax=unclassified Roseibium TaxID=2629323 RepID=UPI00273FECC5|nr:hypothetical protein [Roseibium sp. MMSF_3544]